VALEPVDAAFDRVPLAVVGLVELRRPPAARTEFLPVADPVRRDRNRRFDTASAQVGAVLAGVVCLIGPDSVRALPRPSQAQPGNPDRFQDRLELRGITPLTDRDHHGQRLLPLLDRQVDLAGQPAPGPAKSVVARLDEDPAGRLLLEIPLFAAPAAC